LPFSGKKCGIRENEFAPRIGSGTSDITWPWMASIGYYREHGGWEHFCGATLIDHQFVITAAHCVEQAET